MQVPIDIESAAFPIAVATGLFELGLSRTTIAHSVLRLVAWQRMLTESRSSPCKRGLPICPAPAGFLAGGFERQGQDSTRSWFVPRLRRSSNRDGYVWNTFEPGSASFCSWLAMCGSLDKEIRQEAAGTKRSRCPSASLAAIFLQPIRLSVVERIASEQPPSTLKTPVSET